MAACTTVSHWTVLRSRSTTTGRLRIAGPMLFDGYEGAPDVTSQVLVDGWFLTSDAARIDVDGRLHVLGRLDDVIVTGGVNVPGPAVAARLREHPAITDAEVLGVPDVEWGNRRGGVHRRHRRPRRSTRVGRRGSPPLLGSASARRAAGDPAAGQRQARPGPAPRARMKVFSIPLHTRFRGITIREGLLLRGDAGWGEWSPFLEYDAREAEPWLRCAEEAAAGDWPDPVRDRIPVNVTVPAVGPEQAHRIAAEGGCRTAKVKVAEPGQALADDQARVEAVRDALGPDAADPGRRERRLVGRRGGRGHRRAGTRRRRPGVRRAAVRRRRGPGRGAPPGRCADRGRRVDPPGRGPLPGARPGRRRHRGPQGAAAGRRARVPADRGGHRDAGGRVVGARDLGRHRRWAGPRRCAAGPALRLRARNRPAAHRDVAAEPLLPVDGFLPVGRPARRPGSARSARRRHRIGWRTGRLGWPRCEGCGRDQHRPCARRGDRAVGGWGH